MRVLVYICVCVSHYYYCSCCLYNFGLVLVVIFLIFSLFFVLLFSFVFSSCRFFYFLIHTYSSYVCDVLVCCYCFSGCSLVFSFSLPYDILSLGFLEFELCHRVIYSSQSCSSCSADSKMRP